MQLELSTQSDVEELVFILFMRKFYAHDQLAQLSTIVNDCIAECVEVYPEIADQFDVFRSRAADAFDSACAAPEKGGQGLWDFLESQNTDTERDRLVAQFFAPIRACRNFGYGHPKEVSDAYRT